jgi:exopolyphosphatase / guanosine-5'-triphosphate,3'-diphosphate pyrophosphatase
MKNVLCFLLLSFVFSNQAHTSVVEDSHNKSEKSVVASPHEIRRRAAFDIGSAQIKMQVSDVDLTANKIVNILLTDNAKVALREELDKRPDGSLSAETQNKMVNSIKDLMKKAQSFHPAEYHAIATESLRLAKNADALVERIKKETGLSISIISQNEEGILGFITATNKAGVDPEKAVSWDFGGGSIQITAKCGDHYSVYQGKGKVPFKNALLKIQGKDSQTTLSPNPISENEMLKAVQFIKDTIKDVPPELSQKLHLPDVVVLGVGINPLWGLKESTNYDRKRVLKELEERLNLDDDAICIKDSIQKEYSPYRVSNLILAYGVMTALDIQQIHYVGTEGANAVGALLSQKYWNNSTTVESKKEQK